MTKLSSVVDDYLAFRRSNGFRENTVKNDRQTLARLVKHCGDIKVTDVTATHIDGLLGNMLAERYAVGTVNNTQAGISAFAKWCRSRGYAPQDWDPIAGRRYVPTQQISRMYVPLHDFPKVLDAALNPRDRALMALGLFTMARQSELVNLRVRDLDLTAGTLHIIVLKSYKVDTMPLPAELDAEMRRWMKAYQAELGGAMDPDWFLVPAMEQEGFSTFRLAPDRKISRSEDIVRRVLTRAGYADKRMGVHTLRRSAARALFDELTGEGYDGALRLVSAMLHHQGSATTERYLGISIDRKRRDDRIAGRSLFPSLSADNVVTLHREKDGTDG